MSNNFRIDSLRIQTANLTENFGSERREIFFRCRVVFCPRFPISLAEMGISHSAGPYGAQEFSGLKESLGGTINSRQEQPRLLLLSVPHVLKAADAEKVGGLPASAFMPAAPPRVAANSNARSDGSGKAGQRHLRM